MDWTLSEDITQGYENAWDFVITSSGELETCDGTYEEKQRAILAAFLQKGTIPQLNIGNEWVELLTKQTDINSVVQGVQQNIQTLAQSMNFTPEITVVGDKIFLEVSD